MSKAFDRVDHGLLLCTLSDVGIMDKELNWFESYLKNRKISTCVDCYRSQETPISSGVPQGSVLGPLLFLLFLKDLPTAVSGSSARFADDTLFYDRCAVTSMSPCCRLQQDLDSVDQWAAASATTRWSHQLCSFPQSVEGSLIFAHPVLWFLARPQLNRAREHSTLVSYWQRRYPGLPTSTT